MATIVDDTVAQAINSSMAANAQAAGESRSRSFDMTQQAVAVALANYVSSPSIIAAQGMRMLNGTPTMAPGNAPNANA